MSFEVDVTHRLGSFTLEADFVSSGRLTAFFGRSGSGKTSLINIIAGVLRPDRGRDHPHHAEVVVEQLRAVPADDAHARGPRARIML